MQEALFIIITIAYAAYLLAQSVSDFKTREVYIIPNNIAVCIFSILVFARFGFGLTFLCYIFLSAMFLLLGKLGVYGMGDAKLYTTIIAYSCLFPSIAHLDDNFCLKVLLLGHILAIVMAVCYKVIKKEKKVKIPMFPAIFLAWVSIVPFKIVEVIS